MTEYFTGIGGLRDMAREYTCIHHRGKYGEERMIISEALAKDIISVLPRTLSRSGHVWEAAPPVADDSGTTKTVSYEPER